jgi:hypothetical protein
MKIKIILIKSLGKLILIDFFERKNMIQHKINKGTFKPNNLSAGSKIHENKKTIKQYFKI